MSEQQAIDEIRQQLVSRGDGFVWIDDWRERYWDVAPTPKELMLRHRDKFSLSFEGKRFRVTLVEGAQWKVGKGSGTGGGVTVPKRYPQGAPLAIGPPVVIGGRTPVKPVVVPKPTVLGGPAVVAPTVVAPRVIPPRVVNPLGKGGGIVAAGSCGKGGKAGKGAMPAFAALPAPPGTEEDAVREIRQQLAASKDGYVWIQDWRRRFGHLAVSQKDFIENHGEFFLMSWQGRRYSVEYVGPEEEETVEEVLGDQEQEEPQSPAEDPPAEDELVAEEVAANDEEVAAVDDEALAEDGAVEVEEETTPAAPQRPGQKRPLENGNSAWQPKVARIGNFKEEGTEEDAIQEFVAQLKRQRNNEGKVWINDWKSKYGHLGLTPKEFLECHPERFEILPGMGRGFSVRLVEGEEDV